MTELARLYTADKPIMYNCITFVVDSNLFVEFQPIENIKWKDLCPKADVIKIVVPKSVIREMDGHKSSTKRRLRRRALSFNQHLNNIEDGDGVSAALTENPVKLILELMPIYSTEELKHKGLSLENNDERIVAEAFTFRESHADVIFLSEDRIARHTAREMGIPVARPIESWRLTEPEDPRDFRIRELEAQIGPTPRLSLKLSDERIRTVQFENPLKVSVPIEFCERVAQDFLDNNPCLSQDQLTRRLPFQGGHSSLFRLPGSLSVTNDEIDQYLETCERYRSSVKSWATGLPQLLENLHFVAPFELVISNNGTAFAEDVKVHIRVTQGFFFVSVDTLHFYFGPGVQVPEPPYAYRQFNAPINAVRQPSHDDLDQFAFYSDDGPTLDGGVTEFSYECERFRHGGREQVLSCFLRKEKNAPSGGKVVVTISSASLAKSIDECFIIRCVANGSSDFKEYIRHRISFFPDDVQDVILRALKRDYDES